MHSARTDAQSLKRFLPLGRAPQAFTLTELLVVIGIIAILAALISATLPGYMKHSQMAESLNNLRQIGTGFQLYANDNDFALPSRVLTGDKWPRLLNPYLGGDPTNKIFADPADKLRFSIRKRDPLSNKFNNTSYVMNGYNDLGTLDEDNRLIKSTALDIPSGTLLAATAPNHPANFYLDVNEGDDVRVLDKTLYGNGSTYLFADGSARFLAESDYDSQLWLVNKDLDSGNGN